MKTLIIVDVQKDFYDPSGSLYVKEGEEVVSKIKDLIMKDLSINQIIFTVDWHTPEDNSFEKNGGKWPLHCIQYSEGASLSSDLLEAVYSRGFQSIDGSYYKNNEPIVDRFFISNTYDVFEKGDIPDREEYGAFSVSECSENDERVVIMTGASDESCAYLNVENDIIVSGLAGDYCVLETAKNLLSILSDYPGKLMMFLPGIRSIDGGKSLADWMLKNGVEEYEQL